MPTAKIGNFDTELVREFFQAFATNGGITLHVRDDWASPWRRLKSWGPKDTLSSGPVAFTQDGRSLLIINSEGANTGELRTIRLYDGAEASVTKDPVADVAELVERNDL